MSDQSFSEAPASLNLKFRLGGYDTMLTLRDQTGHALLEKLPTVLKRLGEMGAEPTNGRVSHTDGNGESKTCPVHDVPMKRYSKDGRSWWSHRLPDGGWCKGK